MAVAQQGSLQPGRVDSPLGGKGEGAERHIVSPTRRLLFHPSSLISHALLFALSSLLHPALPPLFTPPSSPFFTPPSPLFVWPNMPFARSTWRVKFEEAEARNEQLLKENLELKERLDRINNWSYYGKEKRSK